MFQLKRDLRTLASAFLPTSTCCLVEPQFCGECDKITGRIYILRRVNETQRATYSWARRVVDIIRKSLAHARAPESGLEAWVEAILNAEEHEGSWCKKDLEKKGGWRFTL